MKTKNAIKILSIILIYCGVFTATASAYIVAGYVTNNSVGINGTLISYYGGSVVYSDPTGHYQIDVSGNVLLNFTNNPKYYYKSISIVDDEGRDQIIDVNLLLKPTGTITGCVYVFGTPNPCDITSTVVLTSNRIRWWF